MGYTAWATTQPSGTALISKRITPQTFGVQYTSVVSGKTATYASGGPMYYLGSNFSMWRGSVNLTLKIVKTQYHSGRLQITFTPGLVVPNLPTTTNSLYSLRTIVDIREQDTIQLNLPYLVAPDYLNTVAQEPYSSGWLDIKVLTDLKAPETCSPYVHLVEIYTPGDDFEFALPCYNQYHNGPFFPQSSGGTGILVDAGIADGQIAPTNTSKSERCVGELFTSVKQILNRLLPVMNPTATPYENSTTVHVDPYFVGAMSNSGTLGTLQYGQTFNDGFSMIALMYAYYKGGMKLSIAHKGEPMAAIVYGMGNTASNNFVSATGTMPGVEPVTNANYGTLNVPFGGTYVHDNAVSDLYVQVPYVCHTPVTYIGRYWGYARPAGTKPTNYQRTRCALASIGSSTTTSTILYNRGCLDDFQMCCFVGCPPVILSFV